jgi:hypothetical protein
MRGGSSSAARDRWLKTRPSRPVPHTEMLCRRSRHEIRNSSELQIVAKRGRPQKRPRVLVVGTPVFISRVFATSAPRQGHERSWWRDHRTVVSIPASRGRDPELRQFELDRPAGGVRFRP